MPERKLGSCSCATTTYRCALDNGFGVAGIRLVEFTEASVDIVEEMTFEGKVYRTEGSFAKQ